MLFPKELKYTRDHEWISCEGEIAYVGVTDYAQSELGEIVYVEVDAVGENLPQSEVFGSIEAVKTVSDLLIPVTGEVLELNPALDDQPELINSDPYGKGWIIKMRVTNLQELEDLLSAEEYQAFLGK